MPSPGPWEDSPSGGRRRRKRKGRRRTKAFLCLALLLHSLIYATFIPIPFCLFALSLGVALGMGGGKRRGKERRRVEKKLCCLNPSQEKVLERGATSRPWLLYQRARRLAAHFSRLEIPRGPSLFCPTIM